MKTILLDEEMQHKMKEPFEGLQLPEFVDRDASDTEKTESIASEQIKEKHSQKAISEESFGDDDALFYNNNYPYDTHQSISSVGTSEHETINKGERKDLTAWLRENITINQRTFNENEIIGNFPRDALSTQNPSRLNQPPGLITQILKFLSHASKVCKTPRSQKFGPPLE